MSKLTFLAVYVMEIKNKPNSLYQILFQHVLVSICIIEFFSDDECSLKQTRHFERGKQ